MSIRDIVGRSLEAASTAELAALLLGEFDELAQRFYRADLRPSELSGGRFAEAAFRVCELACLGRHTPLGTPLPRVDKLMTSLEQTPGTVSETYRLHVPRALRLIYDLRNKRDVAHLGKGVNPNVADATLVIGVAAWVMAELVRIAHACSADEAQIIVDELVERRVPLVWEEGEVLRVLDPGMSAKEQTLLVLNHHAPDYLPDAKLCGILEYSALSHYRSRVLQPLHDAAMIDYRNGAARILPPGHRALEAALRERQRSQ